jgi:Tol biopolymer transport system component/DNA-binding winged helix-turn-helix (wHTH) protein
MRLQTGYTPRQWRFSVVVRAANSDIRRFGAYEFDPRTGELRKQGIRIRLEGQPLCILTMLMERPGELITREEIQRNLWPADTFVDFEHSLNSAIKRLRVALNESANTPRYIETLPGRGYRFIAPLNGVPAAATPLPQPSAGAPATDPGASAHKRRTLAIVAGVAVPMLVLAILVAPRFVIHHEPAAPAFQTMKITQLTSTGNVHDAAISPDGRYVVYVAEDAGRQSLWMRQTATSSAVEIVPPMGLAYDNPTFSPDASYVYYRRRKADVGMEFVVPVLGGYSREVVNDIDSIVTFSRNGKRMAFVRNDPFQAVSKVIVANADGTGEQILATRRFPEIFGSPAWSPDSSVITCIVDKLSGRVSGLYEVRVKDGKSNPITTLKWPEVDRLAWLGDGSGLVLTAAEEGPGTVPNQIWYLPFRSGQARRITNDLNSYFGVALTGDSRSLATVEIEQTAAIWVVPDGDARRSHQITSQTTRAAGASGISWTPDGRIVFVARANNTNDLWAMASDGSQQQLTANGGQNQRPVVSRDGRSILFVSTRLNGEPQIWRIDIDGGNPKPVTHVAGDTLPSVSLDGHWVVYLSELSGNMTLWKAPIEGGNPVQINGSASTFPVTSPDGKWIACYQFHPQEQGGLGYVVAIIPFEGGTPQKFFKISPAASLEVGLAWSPDGQALQYVETTNGISNLVSQPLSGGPPKQLTHFRTDKILSFAWSRDGKQLAVSRGREISDVVLLSDFQ